MTDSLGKENTNISENFNGVEFSDDTLSFHYHNNLIVQSLSPIRGHISGGTIVTIVGAHNTIPSPNVQCKFGQFLPTYGFYDNSARAYICETPTADRSGVVEAFIKTGSHHNWHNTGLVFNFEDSLFIHHINPDRVPETTGGRILIFGEGFRKNVLIYCRFGDSGIKESS